MCCNDCAKEKVQAMAAGAAVGGALGGAAELFLYAAADIICGGLLTACGIVIGALVGLDAAEQSNACKQ